VAVTAMVLSPNIFFFSNHFISSLYPLSSKESHCGIAFR
jgi:hypothetical protein